MSTAFKDFLRQQAEKHEAEAQAGKATVDEWRAAIERLFTQIRKWLKEADSQGVLGIRGRATNGHGTKSGALLRALPWRSSIREADLDHSKAWMTVGTATPPQRIGARTGGRSR